MGWLGHRGGSPAPVRTVAVGPRLLAPVRTVAVGPRLLAAVLAAGLALSLCATGSASASPGPSGSPSASPANASPASASPGATPGATPPAGMLGAVRSLTAAPAPAQRPASELAPPTLGAGLVYGGGPVMHSDRTYAVYWEPAGQTSTAAYKDGVDGFLANVAADSGLATNVYATASLYWDSAGPLAYASTFAGRIVDDTPYPTGGCQGPSSGPCLTDTALQTELKRLVAADGLPTGESTMYMIFTPANVDTCDQGWCSFTAFCAYHSWIGSGPTALIYSDQPYVGGRNGCDGGTHPNTDGTDATVNVVSHEQNEAVTDPEGNAWRDIYGEEIGDKCAWNFGGAIGSTPTGQYNQVIGGHDYWLQQEWSNLTSGCVLTNDGLPPPSVAITTPPPVGAVPGDLIAFAATATDVVASITSYTWDFGDGQTASGALASHAYASFGTYDVTVTATDSNGETASAGQTITLSDQPIAIATASVTAPIAGGSVVFDASASHSPGGAIKSYFWSFYDGAGYAGSATGPTVTETILHPGGFNAYLTVTDANGATGSGYIYFTVTARPPSAAIVASSTKQFTGLSIDFDGTTSTGPDIPITGYLWSFADGSTSRSSSPAHTYGTPGSYRVTLTVTDANGNTAIATQTIEVVDAPPIPVIVFLPRAPTAGTATEFDGEGSYAPIGGLSSYVWAFGDGGAAYTADAQHAYAVPGTYTVSLTVYDTYGFTAVSSKQVVVAPPPPPTAPPTATVATTPQRPSPTTSQPALALVPSAPGGAITLAARLHPAGLGGHGFEFGVSCTAACRIVYRFTIPAHARPGQPGKSTPAKLVAKGSGLLSAGGTHRFTVRLSRSTIALLKPSVRMFVAVDLIDPASGMSRTLVAATRIV